MGMLNTGVATAATVFATAGATGVAVELGIPAIADSAVVQFSGKLASDIAVSGVQTAIYANLPELTAITAVGLAAVSFDFANPAMMESATLDLLPMQPGGAEVEFDPAKLLRIQEALEKTGVSFVKGEAAERYLAQLRAKALYQPDLGKPGVIWLGQSPSRTEVIEELLHLGQDRLSGWRGAKVAEDAAAQAGWELEAQERLLEIGGRLGWTPEELAEIERAKDFWQRRLDTATLAAGN